MQYHVSDLEKIKDALEAAFAHNKARDEMNAAQHLGTPRYSPLTTVLQGALERTNSLIDELTSNSE